jgi:anti-sigma-K factor RskA
MTPEELQELCALYALGALEPHAAAELENRLRAGDAEVVRAIEAYRGVVDLLPYALPPRHPDPAVRAQLMARVRATRPEARGGSVLARFYAPRPWLPTAAAALLALALGWVVYDWRWQVTTLETQVRQLRQVAADHERLLALLSSPGVTVVSLTGTEHAPHAGARLLWDTRRGEWTVLAHNLPTLPAGKAYQLWFLTAAGTPIPSGTFHLDPHQRGMIHTRLPAGRVDIAGAAVSLEPEGGVPQPTGPILLVARL